MRLPLRYVIATLAAAAMATSVMTNAFASPRAQFPAFSQAGQRHQTVNGALTVTDVLRVDKNQSVYGRLYAHGGQQVWKGLLVKTGGLTVQSGGIRSDSLEVAGPLQAQSAGVTGTLQAGTLQSSGVIGGTSLALTNGATLGGALTASGRLSGNGIDAGPGGITTTGSMSASNLTTTGNISSGGTITGLVANLTNLTVTGSVNFTNANVTGLDVSNLNLSSANLQSLNVGNPSASVSPLNISENGQTTQLGVDAAGDLVVRRLVGDSGAFGALSAGTTSGTSAPLTITENGHTAVLGVDSNGNFTVGGVVVGSTTNGDITLGNGHDLHLSYSASAPYASHIIAGNDADVAGTIGVQVPAGTSSGSAVTSSVSFAKPYSGRPIITISASSDPAPGTAASPKVWVSVVGSSGDYTGFVLHYAPASLVANAYTVNYDYHVVGG